MRSFFKRKVKKVMQRQDTLKLGEKTVRVEKITPRQYKELFGVLGSLPNLILQVANAPEGEYQTYLLAALEVGMDDIVGVVSFLTGIDEDYLQDEVGLDDLTEYLVEMVAFNDIDRTLKNVVSLLPKAKNTEAETAAE